MRMRVCVCVCVCVNTIILAKRTAVWEICMQIKHAEIDNDFMLSNNFIFSTRLSFASLERHVHLSIVPFIHHAFSSPQQ